MAPKLHQLIAVMASSKAQVALTVGDVKKDLEQTQPFQGATRRYEPRDDAGDTLPDEDAKVRSQVENLLGKAADSWSGLWHRVFEQDSANGQAKADIVDANGIVLMKDVPVTHMLFLEKQLVDVRTTINKTQTLDAGETWVKQDDGLWKSEPKTKTKTLKIPKVIRLAEATEHHPEQVQLQGEDVIVGDWTTTKFSGAIPKARKEDLLTRVNAMIEAVRQAREKANEFQLATHELLFKKDHPLLKAIFEL